MAPETILNCVNRFVERVQKDGVPVKAAYLFGSWVQGKATEWSDIDLAIISPVFEGIRFNDRRKLDQALIAVDTGIHVHPYRPQDFDKSNPFVREILRTGVRIT